MKKKAGYWKRGAAWLFVLAFLLSACGAGTGRNDSAASEGAYSYNGAGAAGGGAYRKTAATASYNADYDGNWEEASEEEMDVTVEDSAPMMMAAASDGGGESAPASASSGEEQADLKSPNRKIVYTGNVSLQTLDYDKSSQSIHEKITKSGGFIESEDTYNEDPYWYYSDRTGSAANRTRRNLNITARIPAAEFDGFMKSLEEDGQVTNTSVNAQNISVSYATHDASRKALEIEKDRLLEMMDKAETVEEMIAVEERLTQVERELGSEMTQLSAMDRDVDFSTVYINLQEVFEYSEQVVEITFGERLQRAFGRAGESFVDFWQGVVLFIAETFPFLIMWAVVIILIVKFLRRHHRRRMERRAKREEERQKAIQAGALGSGSAGPDGASGAGPETGNDGRGGRKGLFGRRRAAQPVPAAEQPGSAAPVQPVPAAEQPGSAAPVQPVPAADQPEAPQEQPALIPEKDRKEEKQ